MPSPLMCLSPGWSLDLCLLVSLARHYCRGRPSLDGNSGDDGSDNGGNGDDGQADFDGVNVVGEYYDTPPYQTTYEGHEGVIHEGLEELLEEGLYTSIQAPGTK